jgi:type IX secretion system PorP/SprF family membrane protein
MSWRLHAQDTHATQFYNAPYLINSGLVGQFEGQQRYMAYQRTQWKSITVPYKSFALAGEIRNLPIQKWLPKIPNIHSGIALISDRAGDSKFRTTSILIQFAMPFELSDWQFTPALGMGLLNMSIDRSNLYFDRNWNGQVFDPSSPTGEIAVDDGYSRLQLNSGIAMSKQTGPNHMLFGIGLNNIQRPRQNFIEGAATHLQRRWSVHGQVKHQLDDTWSIEPMLLLMFQSPYRSINPGCRVHYALQTPGISSSVYGGLIGRTRDAGNIVIGTRYDQWDIGLSYDINVSDLKPASNGRGGLELTAIYIVPNPRSIQQYRACRKWM